ncbi:hypothetical protein Hanom_Chr13g01216831 [Helianthus anomalus]
MSNSHTFSHLIFELASMCSDMLLLGWRSLECLDLIDVGLLVIDFAIKSWSIPQGQNDWI